MAGKRDVLGEKSGLVCGRSPPPPAIRGHPMSACTPPPTATLHDAASLGGRPLATGARPAQETNISAVADPLGGS
eukprot:CAMPEP_0185156824 /NCGR_PEP_ID=MMETSP1139-20130426/1381_1 /TAXON_ID=298111 /ORGANISM="Pavlova sp., Strain CCMP459" /LENGTH=74 /DNA_ID=CAMNT_0027721859 /DNA_START=90 /DNA_END=311 /DNA_ORIENTATION=+